MRALVVLAAAVVLGLAWAHPSSGPPAPSAPGTVVLGPSALADGLLGLSKPPAPATVSAVPHDSSALVSWSGVTTVSSGTIVGYRVYVDGVRRGPDHPASQRSATVGLSNYQGYRITVRAVDDGGNPESPDSGAVDVTPFDDVAPSAVTGLSATRGDGQVTLTWEPESATEADRAGVRVYVDGAVRASLPAAATTYDVTGLTNDRKHSFYLVAHDARPGGYGSPPEDGPNESARSATVQSTPTDLTPPSAPTAVTAVRGDARATLTWTAPPEGDVDHYEVVDETGARRASFNAPATSGTVGGLTNGQAYRLRLVAVDTHGNHSPASAEVGVTPAKPPATRTGLLATPGDRQVSLSWDPPDTDARRAVATSVDVLVDRVVRTTVTGTATTVTITGLTNGTRYDFSLVAVDAEGRTSPESARVSATPTDPAPPAAPTGVFVARGDTAGVVSWQPVADGDLTGYRVQVSTDGTTWSDATPATTTGTTLTITGLTNGQGYRARVLAHDGSSTSPPSAAVPFTPLAPPAAIAGLSLTMDGDVAVLTWTAPAVPAPRDREAAADVVVRRVGPPDTEVAVLGPGATTYRVTGLAAGEPASFYLIARDGDPRGSAASLVVSVTAGRAPTPTTVPGGGSASSGVAVSRDGRWALVEIRGNGDPYPGLVLDDLSTGTRTVIARARQSLDEPAAFDGGTGIAAVAMSEDGQTVAVATTAAIDATHDADGAMDVYRYAVPTGRWSLVSAPRDPGDGTLGSAVGVPGTASADDPTLRPQIAVSDAGDVFFTSTSPDLVAGASGPNVFVQRGDGALELASDPVVEPLDGSSFVVAPTGAWVAYVSDRIDLTHRLVRHRLGTEENVVLSGDGDVDAGAGQFAVSDDGTTAVHSTGEATATVHRSELTPDGAVTVTDVGTSAQALDQVAIAPDGSVVFFATGDGLVDEDTDGTVDVYRRGTSETAPRLVTPAGGPARTGVEADAYGPIRALSADTVVVVTAQALVEGDDNGTRDAYVLSPAGAHPLVGAVPHAP